MSEADISVLTLVSDEEKSILITFTLVKEYIENFDYKRQANLKSIQYIETEPGKPSAWNESILKAKANICMVL